MTDNAIQEQLKLMHQDLLSKFLELKTDNETIKMRLSKIEAKLGVESQSGEATVKTEGLENQIENRADETKTTMDIEKKGTDMKQNIDDTGFKKGTQDENVKDIGINEPNYMKDDFEEEEEDAVEVESDTGTEKRHVVKLEKLAKTTYKGFCFRPLAAWKNSCGKYEISKEHVRIGEDDMELRISGCDSGEEIAKINIPLKDVEKVEAYFDTKTVLYLYVGEDICEAASQSLAMTNIASFSLIDEASQRIRICFESIGDERKALLREYFRRNAIYFKILSRILHDRIFFKPVQKPAPPKYYVDCMGNIGLRYQSSALVGLEYIG